MCPRLIGYVKSAQLKVCSYGPLNNDPKHAKVSRDLPHSQGSVHLLMSCDSQTQANAGLDVIIVDKVRLISEALAV